MKRLVALILVILLSIESFAAVVSDNDGSAFITKAEFDSLKNNFQSQIDQYNTSIDGKIDGAIASYLSGLAIVKKNLVVLNGEIYDVSLGNGYRSFDKSYLETRIGDCAEWKISAITIGPRGAGWEDINSGIISVPRTTQDLSVDDNIPTFNESTIWLYTTTNGGRWNNTYNLLKDYAATIITTSHVGSLPPLIDDKRPLIFAKPDGTIDSFDNSRITIIDPRFYRISDWPSSMRRGLYLHGTTPEGTPSFNEFNMDEDTDSVPSQGYTVNPVEDPPIQGYGARADGIGTIRPMIRVPKVSYNKNLFCFNLTNNTLIDAFASDKLKVYINSNVPTTAFTFVNEYFVNETITRSIFFDQTSGGTTGDKRFYISRPEVHFRQLVANTILNSSCFATDSNDYYKRLYARYLKNPDFYTSDGTTNSYIYQGLSIYRPNRDGMLEFHIKINTNYNTSALPWIDPGSSNSKLKLRIKNSEFNVGSDTTNAVKMKVGTPTSPIRPDTLEVEEATITKGEDTTIQITCESGKTYFLRWNVDGYEYGGEITYLGNAWFTEE